MTTRKSTITIERGKDINGKPVLRFHFFDTKNPLQPQEYLFEKETAMQELMPVLKNCEGFFAPSIVKLDGIATYLQNHPTDDQSISVIKLTREENEGIPDMVKQSMEATTENTENEISLVNWQAKESINGKEKKVIQDYKTNEDEDIGYLLKSL